MQQAIRRVAPDAQLRRPAFPLSRLASLAGDPAPSLDQQRAQVRAGMRAWLSEPWVQDALFLASPALAETAVEWQRSEGKVDPKLERSLLRYFGRMSARATPFGLFAVNTPALFAAPSNQWRPAAQGTLRRVTRLTPEQQRAWCQHWLRSPELTDRVRWYCNPLLYRVDAAWCLYANTSDFVFQVVTLGASAPLDAVVARSRQGATRPQLMRAIARAAPGTSRAEAAAYFEQLLEQQVLKSELEPPTLSQHPLADLVDRLPVGSAARAEGDRLLASLAALDEGSGHPGLATYAALEAPEAPEATAAAAPSSQPAPVRRAPVHVDLYEPEPAGVDRALVKRVQAVALACLRLNAVADATLSALVAAFEQAHDQRQVRLVDLFGPSSTLSLDGPVTFDHSGAAVPKAVGLLDEHSEPTAPPVSTPFMEFLLPHIGRALAAQSQVVVLSRAELEAAAQRRPALRTPTIGTLAFEVFAKADDQNSPVASLSYLGARPLAALVARLSHGSPALQALARAQLEAEAQLYPGTLAVDVLHVPQHQFAHLTIHPPFGLPTLRLRVDSAVPGEDTVPLDDVLVSVRAGRFVFHSASRQVVLRPRKFNALFDLSPKHLPVYRLLLLVAERENPDYFFRWGLLERLEFLPRLVVDEVVIAPARWTIARSDLPPPGSPPAVMVAALQALRRERRLPRWVRWLVDLAEPPALDLDNIIALDDLAAHLPTDRPLALEELMPGADLVPGAANPEGRYLQQVLAPVVVGEPAPPPEPFHRSPEKGRSRAPGSRWLFAKLYATPSVCDALLERPLRAFIHRARAERRLERWFFIRYNDPHHHLRVRLTARGPRFDPALLVQLERLCAAATRSGLPVRLELDTWDLELERYGHAAGHALTEQWFNADSDAVLDLLARPELQPSKARFELALAGVAGFHRALGFDLATSGFLSSAVAATMRAEAPRPDSLDDRLSAQYRSMRGLVESAITGSSPKGTPGLKRLAARDQTLVALRPKLDRLIRAGTTGLSLERWAMDMTHMHINRLMMSSPRDHEMVLHDFLKRGYRSVQARQRASP